VPIRRTKTKNAAQTRQGASEARLLYSGGVLLFCLGFWAAVFRRLGPIVCVATCRALVEPSCDFSKNIITFQAILRQDPPFSIIIFSKKVQVNV
jgi:hypothetical protein